MPVEINNHGNEQGGVVDVQEIQQPEIQQAHVEEEPQAPINGNVILNGAVVITDPNAPLVVLFGPTSCGKTMTLVRLARYLRNNLGYTVTPDLSFRPAYDNEYQNDCNKFPQTLSDPIAAPGTSGYMLVDVMCNGKILCKILEAPGEYYFDPQNPNRQYPHYMNTIITAPNRKVWCAFVEPNWQEPATRANYVNRIVALKPQMKSSDRMIFVFNKIDMTPFVISVGQVNESLAMQNISNFYPGLFNPFKCTIPIVNWFKKYDCSFVPFQTGIYSENMDEFGNNNVLYAEGPVEYARRLWNEIKRSI